MSAVLSAPTSRVEIVEIEIPEWSANSGEPELEEMTQVVELVRAEIARRGVIALPALPRYGVQNTEDREELKEIKVEILRAVAEQLKGDTRLLTALFLCGLFRLGVTMKYLKWMLSSTSLGTHEVFTYSTRAQRYHLHAKQ